MHMKFINFVIESKCISFLRSMSTRLEFIPILQRKIHVAKTLDFKFENIWESIYQIPYTYSIWGKKPFFRCRRLR